MSELYERIKARRLELGLTIEELAYRMGYKDKSSISKIENGKADIPQSKVVAFARALNTTTAYLMGIDEAKERTIQVDSTPLIKIGSPYHPKSQMPLLGRVAAGLPMFAEENIEGYIANDFTDGEIYYGLYVHGDSMTAAGVDDGDIVIVRQQPCVEENQIAVVLVNGNDATIKYFRQEGDMVILSPRSLNPSHQVQIYDRRKVPIEVIGRVVQIRKNV